MPDTQTLGEAIKILQIECCVPNSIFMTAKYQAIALGIEALKAIQSLRQGTPGLNLSKLPGETED